MAIGKELVNRIQQNKIDIENLRFEADKAEREGDYGKVAEIRYAKIKQKKTKSMPRNKSYTSCKVTKL